MDSSSSSTSKSTNGLLNIVSPTRSPQLPEFFEGQGPKVDNMKQAFAKFSHAHVVTAAYNTIHDEEGSSEDSNENVDGYVFIKDETSNYGDVDSISYLNSDDVDSNAALYNFDYDRDAEETASLVPKPLKLRKPDEYQDLASTSPYDDEEFGDKMSGGSDTIAGRRGLANLSIETPAATGADALDSDDDASLWPAPLKTPELARLRHHQWLQKQMAATRDQHLRALLKRMDQETLDLAESVHLWEAQIGREQREMEIEMELERGLRQLHGPDARRTTRRETDIVTMLGGEIAKLGQLLQEPGEAEDSEWLLRMRTLLEQKREAILADRRQRTGDDGDDAVTDEEMRKNECDIRMGREIEDMLYEYEYMHLEDSDDDDDAHVPGTPPPQRRKDVRRSWEELQRSWDASPEGNSDCEAVTPGACAPAPSPHPRSRDTQFLRATTILDVKNGQRQWWLCIPVLGGHNLKKEREKEEKAEN
ncbi:hypothetical protein PG996_007560 [Apiospora saccharicola]|uniref:BMERB domain-containing protein n=1 Tax=Apiospora saccharicola TaxID=335842 RepID=A0ABR1VEV1_9PEZI